MREFGISKNFIKEKNRRISIQIVLVVTFTIFVMLFFFHFFYDLKITAELFAILGKKFLIIGIILWIEFILIDRRQRKLKVLIYEDKLVRQRGKKQEVFMWEDIIRIRTIENKEGNLEGINLYLKKPKRGILLFGFRETDNLVNLIKEKTSGTAIQQEKRLKKDLQNPFYGLLVGTPVMIMLLLIMLMGRTAVSIFCIFLCLSLSLWLLIFKPLTKLDVCNKWVELIFGILFIILFLWELIELLLYGEIS